MSAESLRSQVRRSSAPPFVFLRFALCGLASAALELAVFQLLWPHPDWIFARIASAGLNYWLVRNWAFRSSDPIGATLPRYLALAAASALLSNTAIQAFTAGLHWHPLAAKAVIDSLLFFANFTLERFLIFTRVTGDDTGDETGDQPTSLPRSFRHALAAFLAASLLLWTTAEEIYGFLTRHLFSQMIWMPWGLHRYVHFSGLYAACSFAVLLFAPWGFAILAAALLPAATMLAVGPLPVLSVALFLVASSALGSLVLSQGSGLPTPVGQGSGLRSRAELGRSQPTLERDVIATLLGAALYVLVFTLTARIPINTPLVWLIAQAAPIAIDFHSSLARLRRWLAALRTIALPTWPERLAFALVVFAILVQWAGAIAPETSADGLGVHLAVPANIAAHHAFTFQPNDLIWSVMPLAADFAYSIVYLTGGEPAPSLLNFTLLLALAALLYYACRRCVSRPTALLLTALFLTTPLVQLVTGSLFVENFVAALALGSLAAYCLYTDSGGRRFLLAASLLAGSAIAAKLAMWAVVLAAIPFAIADARRRRAGRVMWLAAALLLATALPPYAIAYLKTGNPLFPFLNDKFPSTALPHGTIIGSDARYSEPLTWSTPFDLTFRTHNFFESQDGGVGFALLLLIPLAALALFVMRNRRAVISAAVALAAGALIFLSRPNARYLYSVIPLFVIAFAGMLQWLRDRPKLRAALIAFTIAATALDIYFIPASGWYRKDFYSPLFFRPGGREQYLKDNVPVRYLIREFRRQYPVAPALMIGETDLADMGDHAYQYVWHQWSVFTAIANAQGVTGIRRVLLDRGIHYVTYAVPNEDSDLIQPSSLREYLADCSRPILQRGRFYVSEIDPRCERSTGDALKSEIAAMPAPLVAAGTYDDFHPAVLFHGDWIRSRSFDGPFHHTISYSDDAAASVKFAFAGSSLDYIHTNAPNRAIVELTIDGVPHEIDCYSPAVEWQSQTAFPNLGAGQHSVTLRSTARANRASQGKYIDIDAFVAR